MNIKPAKRIIIDQFLRTGVSKVADLGSGDGKNSCYMSMKGCEVTAVDIHFQPNICSEYHYEKVNGDITDLNGFKPEFDGVLASHCLEHVVNPFDTLLRWRGILKNDGYLCVIVPPFVHRVVGRHVFVGWNVGNLMLLLLRAGFDIADGHFIRKDYNVAAIVRKSNNPVHLLPNDEILIQHKALFPPCVAQMIDKNKIKNEWGEEISFFEGAICSINWR